MKIYYNVRVPDPDYNNQLLISLVFGSNRSSRNANLFPSVRMSGPSLSGTLNLHLFDSDSLQEQSESTQSTN